MLETARNTRTDSRRDLVTELLGLWLVLAVFLDGWAHINLPSLETFFTPWHAVLYAGYGAVALLLGAVLAANMLRRYAWVEAMPPGYLPGLFGAAVFALGGVGDMFWHTLFGIERNMEALLSPTHLLLALGAALMVTSPPRAAWRRPAGHSRGWRGQAPILIGLALLLATSAVYVFSRNRIRTSSKGFSSAPEPG